MRILAVGFNHKKTDLSVREILSFDRVSAVSFLQKLNSADVISESLLLSTCNRTEVYLVTPCIEGAIETLFNLLSTEKNISSEELKRNGYIYSDEEAVKHIFRVAGSLDAMVVGESQILGQLKNAYQLANEADTAGTYLHKLCHMAFRVAKRVRTETKIAESSVSVGSIAVEKILEEFEDISRLNFLVVGAGEMSSLVAKRLKDRGAEHLWISNRSEEGATLLAEEVKGDFVPFKSFWSHISTADVVIISVGGGILITKEKLQKLLPHRRLFVVDLGMPRNVDDSAKTLGNVTLCNIDDLLRLAEENSLNRKEEALKAEDIVKTEAASCFEELQKIKLFPLIQNLKEKCEKVVALELEKLYLSHPSFTDAEKASVKRCAESIVKKILHEPITTAKEEIVRSSDISAEIERTLNRVFQLYAD